MTIDLMEQALASAPQGVIRRYGLRALLTVAAAAVLAYWLLFSALLAMFACDDNCSDRGQADWWGYDAQFFLAAAGCLLGAVALVLGFTSKEGPYRRFLAAALACGLVWVFWVMGSGSF